MNTQTNLSKGQMCWIETLPEYEYVIVYVQSKLNVVVDALSNINESAPTKLYTGIE
jgi:hypothetical protein